MIKILWVVNDLLPAVKEDVSGTKVIGGSWLNEPLILFSQNPDYELHIVTLWHRKEEYHKVINNIHYHVLCGTYMDRFIKPSKKYLSVCKKLVEEINPDVFHIHGSEFAVVLGFLPYVKDIPKLLSIQGLISVINQKYFYGGINVNSGVRGVLPDKFLTMFPMKIQHERNRFREKNEIKQLQLIDAVTGCTHWDYAHAKAINENLGYYPIEYAIRREFDEVSWNMENVDKHTVFCGSMMVPLKGFHVALEAVAILKKKYPDIKIRVAGYNEVSKKHPIGYPRYLKKLITKLDLWEQFEPLGGLDGTQMAQYMSKTHTFLLSSCIENGPNVMLEAMRVGMPCVCSYVGGAMDFAHPDDEALFYRFEEPIMLAHQIERIWENDDLANKLSENGKIAARRRGDYNKVYSDLQAIYKDMLRDGNVD